LQIAADAVLKQYFDDQEILTPDYILIDWTFDEGDSSIYGSDHQYIYNHHGSLNANLVAAGLMARICTTAPGMSAITGPGLARCSAKRKQRRSDYCKSFN
jgi:hypothetical protein